MPGKNEPDLKPHSRGFRRKQRNLLKRQQTEPDASANSVGTAATATHSSKTLVAVVDRGEVGQQGSRQASEQQKMNNILAATGSIYNVIVNNHLNQHRALVLDSGYRPINVIAWPKAVYMDVSEKGEVIEYYPPPAGAWSGRGLHSLPAVVRVKTYVDLNDLCTKVTCTRRNIMIRDRFTCQYCRARRDLTIDHVMPVSKGGKDTWDNLVTACIECNQRKGSSTLQQLGWRLKHPPREPSPWEIGVVVGINSNDIECPPPEWQDYIAPYKEKIDKIRRQAEESGADWA